MHCFTVGRSVMDVVEAKDTRSRTERIQPEPLMGSSPRTWGGPREPRVISNEEENEEEVGASCHFLRLHLTIPGPTAIAGCIRARGEGEGMAIGKEIGQFSIKSTSVSYAEDGGSVQINCEGTATKYGTVVGTLILRGEPGAKSGRLSWRGQGFLENGETAS